MWTIHPVPARLRSRSNRSADYPADHRADRTTHDSAGHSTRADTDGRIALSSGKVGKHSETEEGGERNHRLTHGLLHRLDSHFQRHPLQGVPVLGSVSLGVSVQSSYRFLERSPLPQVIQSEACWATCLPYGGALTSDALTQ